MLPQHAANVGAVSRRSSQRARQEDRRKVVDEQIRATEQSISSGYKAQPESSLLRILAPAARSISAAQVQAKLLQQALCVFEAKQAKPNQ
jgi:hypothetical protein